MTRWVLNKLSGGISTLFSMNQSSELLPRLGINRCRIEEIVCTSTTAIWYHREKIESASIFIMESLHIIAHTHTRPTDNMPILQYYSYLLSIEFSTIKIFRSTCLFRNSRIENKWWCIRLQCHVIPIHRMLLHIAPRHMKKHIAGTRRHSSAVWQTLGTVVIQSDCGSKDFRFFFH